MNKKLIIVILLTVLFLTMGCASSVDTLPTATPGADGVIDVAGTMAMAQMNANATEQAVGIAYTATSQVIMVTVTAQAREDAIATSEQQRRDAQATSVKEQAWAAATEQQRRQDAAATQARIDAEATAQQAERNIIGTATAQQQTFYNNMTMAVQPTHAIWTQQAVAIDQALATNEVALSNLEVEQQSQKNTPEWVIPLLIAIAATVAGVFYLVRHSFVREIRNPETGVVEAVIFNNRQVVKPALVTGPVLTVGDVISLPLLADPEVVRRDQLVQALHAMPTQSPTQMAQGLMQGVFGGTPANRFEILSANDAPPAKLVDAHALSALEQDWKEGQHD